MSAGDVWVKLVFPVPACPPSHRAVLMQLVHTRSPLRQVQTLSQGIHLVGLQTNNHTDSQGECKAKSIATSITVNGERQMDHSVGELQTNWYLWLEM